MANQNKSISMFRKLAVFIIMSSIFLPFAGVFAGSSNDIYSIGSADANLSEVVSPTNTGISITELGGERGFLTVLIKGLLGATGLAFFLFTIYGGFLWMTARGDDSKVERGRDIVIQATIGLVIIVAAYAITTVIVGVVTGVKK